MGETDRLSALIGDIYDAALNSSLWPDVLGKTTQFIGGPSAALWSKDLAGKTGNVSFFSGFDPGYVDAYLGEYMDLDPAATGHFFAGIAEPVAQASLIARDEFRETRFYREWAKPQGLVDCVTAALDKSDASIALFGISRHRRDGIADDDTRRRMRFVAPHIRRALLVGRAAEFSTAEAAAFADTFDGVGAGMFLVDGGERLIHTNVAGQAMLDAGDFLRFAGGRLVGGDAKVTKLLHEAFTAASGGDAATGTKGIALTLTAQDGEPYVAHVLPLTSGTRRLAGAVRTATAALFVHQAALSPPAQPEAIARHYRLTPAELRVLLAVVAVGGVPEVAEALGVAETTVKTHLRRLYAKTGTGRQADLVRLVAGFASPLLT
jgi:DNA-binding CsgD family transcriptional regulator